MSLGQKIMISTTILAYVCLIAFMVAIFGFDLVRISEERGLSAWGAFMDVVSQGWWTRRGQIQSSEKESLDEFRDRLCQYLAERVAYEDAREEQEREARLERKEDKARGE